MVLLDVHLGCFVVVSFSCYFERPYPGLVGTCDTRSETLSLIILSSRSSGAAATSIVSNVTGLRSCTLSRYRRYCVPGI